MDEAERKVESLRAMLLAERSRSKIARQKADQLAARESFDASCGVTEHACTSRFHSLMLVTVVYELETQLEIVNNQKQKAEKAAAKVLSILRDGGIIEYSDEGESETGEQAISCEYEEKKLLTVECLGIVKTEGCSLSDAIRDEVKDGELEKLNASPSTSASLSWTSSESHFSGSHGNGSRKSHELAVRQKQGNFVSVTASSPKRRLGKSCRQIKRREIGSMKEQGDTDCSKSETLVEGHPNDMEDGIGPPPCSETTPEQTSGEENCCAKVFPEDTQDIPPLEEGSRLDSGSDASARDEDIKMERILEQQTQIVDQCQSEENLQQDQEEKAKDVTVSIMVLPEPAEHPDASIKAITQAASVDIENSVADMKSTPETNCNRESVISTRVHDVLPKISQDTAKTEIGSNWKPSHENEHSFEAIPADRNRDIAMGLVSNSFASAQADSNISVKTSPNELKFGDVLRRDSYAALSKGKQPMFYVETPSPSTPGSLRSQMSWRGPSANQNAVVASASQSHFGSASPNDLEGVLKNLQLARFSLQSRLEKSSLSKGKIVATSDEAKIAEESMKLPFISCSGLFRLPPSLHDSETGFSSQSLHSNLVTRPALSDQRRHRHRDSRFQISAGNMYSYAPSIAPSASSAQPQYEDPYSRFAGFQYSHTDEQNRNFRC
ncbi:uncharacterized protein LOC116259730 isoform X2 [Nymphaea colorata]|uniref:uncharacterized protein LOC116259730 isoform X2 n=1 Tax=Nymphaea colorata TaxID=210225 RepID=UPI00129E2E36|nr:uncharacterized protein LOC116259730 isoform X2 [Nymphaea colorata]